MRTNQIEWEVTFCRGCGVESERPVCPRCLDFIRVELEAWKESRAMNTASRNATLAVLAVFIIGGLVMIAGLLRGLDDAITQGVLPMALTPDDPYRGRDPMAKGFACVGAPDYCVELTWGEFIDGEETGFWLEWDGVGDWDCGQHADLCKKASGAFD